MTDRGETTRQLQTYENSRYIIVHGAKGVWGIRMEGFSGGRTCSVRAPDRSGSMITYLYCTICACSSTCVYTPKEVYTCISMYLISKGSPGYYDHANTLPKDSH